MLRIITVQSIFTISLLVACQAQSFKFDTYKEKPVSHEQWDGLLKKHVSEDGTVNYKGFIQDSTILNQYLGMISKGAPDPEKWSKDDQVAYWINAYNAYTVQLIIRNYPVKSIKDLGGGLYKINTTWDIKFIEIGGEELDLNNIEHKILRKDFDEPRIHFAVNCASVSCPKLRNEAFVGNKLDAQLTDQTKDFLAMKGKNEFFGANKAEISKLFTWFSGDFKIDGSVIKFINKYAPTQLNEDAELSYKDYDWNLNE